MLRRPVESAQYLSIRYTERLVEAGVERSVGSIGDSYDNALAETVNGLYKTEVIYPRRPRRHAEQVEYATLEWVDWLNNRRLLEPIGNVPPAEFERRYYEALAGHRMETVKYGNNTSEGRIDVQNWPESPDLGSVHTQGPPGTNPTSPSVVEQWQ